MSESGKISNTNNKIRLICFILLLIHIFFIFCGENNAFNTSEFDEYLNALNSLNKFSGSVIVAKDGEVIYEKAFGKANYENGIVNSVDTKFSLGNLCSPLTSISILQLSESGKISLNERLSKYIDGLPAKWSTVTIHHLLNHQSGIVDFTRLDKYKQLENRKITIKEEITLKEMVGLVSGADMRFLPGMNYSFSSTNYLLLNYLIEELTGVHYEEYVKTNIFKKAGMNGSGDYRTLNSEIGHAVNYTKLNETPEKAPVFYRSIIRAAAGFYSTVRDLYKLDRALYDETLLKRSSIDKMYTPYKYAGISTYNYGYGWYIFTLFDKKVFGHDSHHPGTARMLRFTQENLFVGVLCNSEFSPIILIPRDLAAIVFGTDYEFPHVRKTIKPDPELFKQYAGDYKLNDYSMRVYAEGDSLFFQLQVPGAGKRNIQPETDTKFFIGENDIYYSFSKNTTGEVDGFIVHWYGHKIKYERLEK